MNTERGAALSESVGSTAVDRSVSKMKKNEERGGGGRDERGGDEWGNEQQSMNSGG